MFAQKYSKKYGKFFKRKKIFGVRCTLIDKLNVLRDGFITRLALRLGRQYCDVHRIIPLQVKYKLSPKFF